jgi:hypothetical protein
MKELVVKKTDVGWEAFYKVFNAMQARRINSWIQMMQVVLNLVTVVLKNEA